MNRNRIVALLLTVTIVSGGIFWISESNVSPIGSPVKAILTNQDRVMAESVADITGESVNNIMNLYSKTGNWKDVMSTLNSGDQYMKFLTEDELNEKLSKESFAEEKVKESKMFSEQIQNNLREISLSDNTVESVAVNTAFNVNKDYSEDISNYKKLEYIFDKNLAVYLSLKLEEQFGSIQQAMDEYLYCLQTDVDLKLCLIDKDEYDQIIMEKSIELLRDKAITIQKISDFMLNILRNKKQTLDEDTNKYKDMEKLQNDSYVNKKTVNDILPDVQDPRPKDPALQVRDEIDSINNIWMDKENNR